jgi:drug/metabolite transporter (DMT)-like permease
MSAWIGIALASVVLASCGQFAWKLGARVLGSFSFSGMLLSPYVWAGLALFGVSSVLWIKVLTRAPLSLAYPLTALNYLIILLLSWRFLGEPITAAKGLGVLAVCVGVVLIGVG